jgi:hypothetical protein
LSTQHPMATLRVAARLFILAGAFAYLVIPFPLSHCSFRRSLPLHHAFGVQSGSLSLARPRHSGVVTASGVLYNNGELLVVA